MNGKASRNGIKNRSASQFCGIYHTKYPGIDICSARQLTHDGEFNDILIVNDDLVFRFPRYAENIPGFLREIQLLAKLQGRLPLPIPNPIYTSGTTTELGNVFMGYGLSRENRYLWRRWAV